MSFEKRAQAAALFFLLQAKDTRWLRFDRKESHPHPPCKETGSPVSGGGGFFD